MYKDSTIQINDPSMVLMDRTPVKKEAKVFKTKLRSYLNMRIHLKIEGDEMPIAYLLKEIGKDYLIVVFGENERIVPLEKVIFVQMELNSTGERNAQI